MADISKEQAVRDAFEKHWLELRGEITALKELQRHTLQPQFYERLNVNRHWYTWQAAYKLGRNAGLEEALNCYSPDDTATDWADKIKSLKDNTP